MSAHRLTFRQADLELVTAGTKTATIRFSEQSERIVKGDALRLAFGRYDRPTVLEATVTRVLTFDLTEPMLELGRRLEQNPDATIEPDSSTCDPEMLEALGASFSVLDSLLSEAADRDQAACVAVWWKLTPPAELREAA